MERWKCYVVYKGKVLGVYNEWPKCQAQVNRFKGAIHKGFTLQETASLPSVDNIRQRRKSRRQRVCRQEVDGKVRRQRLIGKEYFAVCFFFLMAKTLPSVYIFAVSLRKVDGKTLHQTERTVCRTTSSVLPSTGRPTRRQSLLSLPSTISFGRQERSILCRLSL